MRVVPLKNIKNPSKDTLSQIKQDPYHNTNKKTANKHSRHTDRPFPVLVVSVEIIPASNHHNFIQINKTIENDRDHAEKGCYERKRV